MFLLMTGRMQVRGLSDLTFTKDWDTAGRFLSWLGSRANAAAPRQLVPVDLDAFIARRVPGLRRATRSEVCHGLRSFLR